MAESPLYQPGKEIETKDLIALFKFAGLSSDLQGSLSQAKISHVIDNPFWAIDQDTRRLFLLGNEHRDIYNFMRVCEGLALFQPKISIVNFDDHIDDASYQNSGLVNGLGLNASWQKYFVDIGLTAYEQSYNVFPYPIAEQTSNYAQQIEVSPFAQFYLPKLTAIDVTSVDLDFFNSLRFEQESWQKALAIIQQTALRSKAVMLFSSPSFTQHLEGINIARQIYSSVISTPVDPVSQVHFA